MAGSYPDVPGYRFAYDLDGTIAGSYNTNTGVSVDHTSSLSTWNNESNSSVGVVSGTSSVCYLYFIFPEPRNISGVFINSNWSGTVALQWSNDTTSGLDGNWTSVVGFSKSENNDKTVQRNNIVTMSLTEVTALRTSFAISNNTSHSPTRNIHIYGSIPADHSPNRLRIVDTSDEDIAAQLDFGNIPQRNNVTKQFKVINNSSTQTANNITITLSAPTDTTPSIVGQFQVSTDNVAFANAVNIGDLGPGESSGTLYVRNAVASNAQLGLWTARMVAHPTSWS